ncbi:copper amine oxidase N-terminal domain-containing protein [Acidaminobacter sp. JC074]|uniref:Ig-like domain-containing protein n=1 Tax=Acidaminobacter sp. JC074 TaxID=2530199 RepID=UPI001F0FAC63|nr:Ig-like domain-containing protein [Acidaminobacter sp. JC074]MCH4885976.1 copper amine oxidase N-terminal domain-containing protein [Acidaminobacter sp. JC074]
MKVNCFKRVLSCVLIMTCLLTSIPVWAVEDEEAMPYEKIYVEDDPTNQALLDSVELPDFIDLPYRYSQVTLVLETNKDVTYRYKMANEDTYQATSDKLVIVDMPTAGVYKIHVESKSKDEVAKNYLIHLERNAPSSDATLNAVSISVDGLHTETNPMYSKDVEGIYRMDVRNSVAFVDIAARPSVNSSFASCYLVVNDDFSNMTEFKSSEVLQYDLEVGRNRFKIRSQAEDGTIKDYTYEITRADINHEPVLNVSSPANDRSIEKGHNYGFSLEGTLEDEDGDNTTVRASIGGVSGNVWRNPNDRSQFSLDWGVDDLTPGTYQGIDIEYSDGQVNKTWKWPYTLVITPAPGNSLPVLDIQSPTSDVTLTDKFVLSGQVKDDNTEDVTVMAVINNVPKSVRLLATPEGKPFELEWSIEEIHNGTYENIRIGAFDKLDSNQVINGTWNHTLTVNDSQNLNRQPIVSFDPSCLYHTSGSYGTFEVSGTVQDPDLDSVIVNATIGGNTQSATVDTKENSSWTLAWKLNELIPETYTDIPINITDGTNTSQLIWNKRLVVEPFVDQAPYFEAVTPLDNVELNEGTFMITADIRDRECDELTLSALINGVEAKVVKKSNPHYNLFRLEWDISEISNGDYSDIELIAVDEKNNKTITTIWSHTLTVNKPNQSPRLVVNQPPANVDFKTGTFSVTGSVEDHEGDDVLVSGTLGGVTKSITVEKALSRTAYTLTWDRSDFTDTGSYNNVTVIADDKKSTSVSDTKSFTFNVLSENEKPSGEITSPLVDLVLVDGNFVLSGRASDSDTLTVSTSINNVLRTDELRPGETEWSLVWSKEDLSNKNYGPIEVTLDDTKAQTVLTWNQTLIVNDLPSLVISAPSQDIALTAGVFTLSGTAFDNDEDEMTVSATIDGVLRETRISSSDVPSDWSLTWNKTDFLQADKSVEVTVTDVHGSSRTESWAYELKKNALPSINIRTSGNQTLTEGTFSIEGSIDDPEDEEVTVKLHILDQPYTTTVASGQSDFSFNIDYADLRGDLEEDKVYDDIKITAEDSIGLSQVSWPYTLTLANPQENRLPNITISSPTDHDYLTAGSFVIAGSVRDLDGDEVTVSCSIDGQEKTTTITGSGDFTFEWDKSTITQKDYSDISIRALDSQGGQSTYDLDYNLYKNEKPVVTITSNETELISGKLTLTGTVYDRENETLQVTASVGSIEKSVSVSETNSSPTWSIDFTYEELLGDLSQTQSLDIKASARDSVIVGDEIIREDKLTLVYNTAPIIELTAPLKDIATTGINLTLSGRVTDAEGGLVTISSTIGDVSKEVSIMNPDENTIWRLSWTYDELPHSLNGLISNIKIHARDAYGAESETTWPYYLTVNKHPTLEVTSPPIDMTMIYGKLIVEGTTTDYDNEEVFVSATLDGKHGKNAIVSNEGTTRTWRLEWDRSELSDRGKYHNVVIKYFDINCPEKTYSWPIKLQMKENTLPVLTFDQVDDYYLTKESDTFRLSGRVTDADGGSITVRVIIDDEERDLAVEDGIWSFNFKKSELTHKTYDDIEIYADDSQEGTASKKWPGKLIVDDNVSPVLTITSPTNHDSLIPGEFVLSGSITDADNQIVTVSAEIDGNKESIDVNTAETNEWSLTWDKSDLTQKDYTITVTAEDEYKASVSKTWAYALKENIAPSIEITSPLSDQELYTGDFVLRGIVTNPEEEDIKVSATINGHKMTETVLNDSDGVFNLTWQKHMIGQETIDGIVISATDSSKTTTKLWDYTLRDINHMPDLEVEVPDEDLIHHKGQLIIRGKVNDSDGGKITVKAQIGTYRSVVIEDIQGETAFELIWDRSALVDGTYNDIEVIAEDATGAQVKVAYVNVQVLDDPDNTLPELVITHPTTPRIIEGPDAYILKGTVKDVDEEEVYVRAFIKGVKKEVKVEANSEPIEWQLKWTKKELDKLDVSGFTVYADDGSKDLTQVEHNKRLLVRNSAPVVTFTSPTDRYVLKGDKFVLKGTVHDDEENWMILSAKLKGSDGRDVESIAHVKYENGVGNWQLEWLKSDLMNKTYNGIDITYDEAHHFEQKIRWPYELKVTDETNEKPELTIDEIGSYDLIEGSFELTGNVSDYENNPVSVSTSIDGKQFDGLIDGSRWTLTLDKSQLPYGVLTGIVVTASDEFGSSSQTWPGSLTVVNSHPEIVIETSEDAIVLDEGSFTLSGTISDLENDIITLEAQLGKSLKNLEVDTKNENTWSMTWTKDEIGPIEATSIDIHVKMDEILKTLTWGGTIEVVNKKPRFEINVPSENLIMNGDTYILKGRVEDVDNQTVTITALVGDQRFDTSVNQTKDGVDWTIECLRSDLSIGIHLISFEVSDGISSEVYDSGYTMDVKDKPPVFKLFSESNQTLTDGSFTLEGTIEDPEGRSVIIKASIGGLEKTFTSKVNNLRQNWTLTWDYEDLASGDYSDIVVSADDGTNLVDETWSHTFSIANKRPTLSLNEVEGDFEIVDDKYVLKSGVFIIKGQVSDPENDELTISARIGDHIEDVSITPSSRSDFELSFSKDDLDNGIYSDIEVIVDDKNGELVKSTWAHTLQVKDLSSPEVSILSPSDDQVMTSGIFTISGQVSDPDGGKVKLEATIDGHKAEVEVEDASSSQSFSLTWDVGELSRTTYQNVQVKAVDDTGRSSSELWPHKLRVRDYTPPSVSFDINEDIHLTKGSFTISGLVSDTENDDVSLQVRVGDLFKAIHLTNTKTDKTWSATFDKKDFNNGDYIIEVDVSDASGSRAVVPWPHKLSVADDVVKMNALDPGQEVSFVGRQWKVLDPTSGLAILTENVGSRPWSTKGESDYSKSDIRKYLNEVFISKDVLDTLSLQTWSWSGDTSDKIGLLSGQEYETYKALLTGPEFSGDWWLLDSQMTSVSSVTESSIKSIYPVVHFETNKDVVNSLVESGGFVIDTVSPTISISGVTDNGTYRSSVSPVVTISDNVSKLSEMTIDMQLDGKDFVSGTGISELGHHVLRVYVTDKNGNSKEVTIEFDILQKRVSNTSDSSDSSSSRSSSSRPKKKPKKEFDMGDVLITDHLDLKSDTASVVMNTELFRRFATDKDDFMDNPYVVMLNKELKYSETKEILKRLDPLSEDTLTGIGHRAFTLDMSLSNGDGQYLGLDYFDEPLKVSIDLSKNFAVNKSNIDKLTAIRYEKDYSGYYTYEKLGGDYNEKDKTFTFYTNQDGLFNIMVSDNLTQIELQIDNLLIEVDDKTVKSDVAPRIISGRTIVPVRFIAEHLDAKVKWFEKERKVTITKDGRVMPLYIDKTLRGYNMTPIIINSRTMVPLRYVYEAFGAKVMWFPSTRKIMVVK